MRRQQGVPPPPIATIAAPVIVRPQDGPPVTFDVDVRMGNEVIWSGPMRVARYSPARFERRKTDAPAELCTDGNPGAAQSENSNLTVNLSRSGMADNYALTVIWVRPGAGEGCAARSGSRTIGITHGFALASGREMTVSGDGGLTVRLRARP